MPGYSSTFIDLFLGGCTEDIQGMDTGGSPCSTSPCGGGGTCEEHDGTFTCYCTQQRYNYLPVCLGNRLISAGLELVVSPVLYHIVPIFFTNIYRNVQSLYETSFVSPCLQHLWANKSFNLRIVHFYIRGKLLIIRCNKL